MFDASAEFVALWHLDVFSVFDLAAYLPDSVIPAYEDFKDAFVVLLQTFGIIKPQKDLPSGTGELPTCS